MCDSTNAERPGFTMSEKTVGRTIDAIFDDNKNSRIIIATFASNVDRVQQIINAAYKNGRKVIVEGRSMVNIIGTASELGYINIPDNTLIDIEQLKIIRMNRLSLLQPEVRRVHGGTVKNGIRHSPQSDDQAKRYDRVKFQPNPWK